ncbi:TadE/TadG family type IV pilus assembly protein [Marinobacter confluentis]|uniref:TadE-like domain-containing protein n=1 Tax=Marinobacter confluentis TaxID=1697557 RepID=A0A4Z1C867_9GAMM|nr:TadE/TadG family type IV pilus assembly protein [Marinobacter confluentis]TGN41860.1 hypothetical protein E5Q11_04900 [Marinobacter confluentis]
MDNQHQKGQALVEMVVIGPLIIAIAAGIMALALYFQAKTLSVNAARYAVWERSVWADPERPWNGGHDEELGGNASSVLRSDYSTLDAGLALYSNPNLRIRSDRSMSELADYGGDDHNTQEVLSWGGETRSGFGSFGGNVGTFIQGASDTETRSAWEHLHSRYAATMDYEEQSGARPSSTLHDFNIDPIANMGLEMPTEALASADATINLRNVFQGAWSLGWLDFDSTDGSDEFTMTSTASLLTNPWAPKNEAVYKKKVHSLSVKQLMDYITIATDKINSGITGRLGDQSKLLEYVPILGPTMQAKNPELEPTSTAMPLTRVIPGNDE